MKEEYFQIICFNKESFLTKNKHTQLMLCNNAGGYWFSQTDFEKMSFPLFDYKKLIDFNSYDLNQFWISYYNLKEIKL